ncbi:MAG: hypothetical protein JWQ34_3119 [Mucilaginibacter sp.]|nr:hypothetical protein [Mucilaginibacter sp.]
MQKTLSIGKNANFLLLKLQKVIQNAVSTKKITAILGFCAKNIISKLQLISP